MKKVGIIGGAGFIGSYVTKLLLEAGHRVRVSATKPGDTARYAHLQQWPVPESGSNSCP